jgi:hypothetical protein
MGESQNERRVNELNERLVVSTVIKNKLLEN